MKAMNKIVLSSLVMLGTLFLATEKANASVTDQGITYSLTISPVNSIKSNFTLTITGINGWSDDEKGRSGVNAFAFNNLPNLSSALAPSGFAVGALSGGLSSSGCSGSGNFLCFKNTDPPSRWSALPANSVLVYTFSITASSAYDWSKFDPSFKIDWVGSKNNYDLVSRDINPDLAVPEPTTMLLLGSGSLLVGYLKKRKSKPVV